MVLVVDYPKPGVPHLIDSLLVSSLIEDDFPVCEAPTHSMSYLLSSTGTKFISKKYYILEKLHSRFKLIFCEMFQFDIWI
jgi:hypothetical protein